MLPPVQSILEDANIHSLGSRIFQTNAPEDQTKNGGATLDYVVWLIVSNVPNNNLSDSPDDDEQRVQVDVYSADQSNARGLAERVRDAIEVYAHVIRGPEPMFETDNRIYRWSMDATFFTNRS